MPMLYTLRRVSKQWQEVIDGTPSFWALLLSTLPSHVNNTALLRSGSHPLTIVYQYPRRGTKDKHPSPEDFLSTAVEALPRWLSYSGPVVSRYLETPAPLMRHIALRDVLHGQPEPLELLGGRTTTLRYVNLSGVSVRWRADLFTELKVLDLGDLGEDGLTVGHILDFLRASPQLERFRLETVRATDDGAQSPSVITLHHLRSIDISDCDITRDILRQIQAPACIDFYLDVIPSREDPLPSFLDEVLQHFRGTLHDIHVRNGSSKISLSYYGFYWHIPGEGVDGNDFSVHVEHYAPVPCLKWVEQILQSGTGLGIIFDRNANIAYDALESMAPMRCITNVAVADLRDRMEVLSVLQFISVPLSAGASLPLPCLREVRLESAEWNEQDLLDMVQSRSNSLSLEVEERPLLTISIMRGAFTNRNTPRPIVDYATLTKIRETNGVERVQYVGSKALDGMLAIIWNEEACEPIWG